MKNKIIAAMVFAGMTCTMNVKAGEMEIPESAVAMVKQEYINTEQAKTDAVLMCNRLNDSSSDCIEVMHMDFFQAQVEGVAFVLNGMKNDGVPGVDESTETYVKDIECVDEKASSCRLYKTLMGSNFMTGYFKGMQVAFN